MTPPDRVSAAERSLEKGEGSQVQKEHIRNLLEVIKAADELVNEAENASNNSFELDTVKRLDGAVAAYRKVRNGDA